MKYLFKTPNKSDELNNKIFGCIGKGWISDILFHYFFDVCGIMIDEKPYFMVYMAATNNFKNTGRI